MSFLVSFIACFKLNLKIFCSSLTFQLVLSICLKVLRIELFIHKKLLLYSLPCSSDPCSRHWRRFFLSTLILKKNTETFNPTGCAKYFSFGLIKKRCQINKVHDDLYMCNVGFWSSYVRSTATCRLNIILWWERYTRSIN